MQERRQHKRFTVVHTRVEAVMPLASSVIIMDLSASGMLVKADRRLNIGSKYSLKIGFEGEVFTVRATVMRCLLVESVKEANGNIKPIYLAGMQFIDGVNEKIEEIVNFIKTETQSVVSKQILNRPDTEFADGYVSALCKASLRPHMTADWRFQTLEMHLTTKDVE